jgi:UDP-N-acetylglucosamine:LPS N-acetylglucosamine transferase
VEDIGPVLSRWGNNSKSRSTYELLDILTDAAPPFNSLASRYKHISNRPSRWKIFYHSTNTKAFEYLAGAYPKRRFEKAVRRRIRSHNPDVVVSVHPLMTNVPVLSCSKISTETGKHLPIFTVVTDLGSAHWLWFARGVEKMFVGSEAIKELAKVRGKVPEEKLILYGLPIRHDFSVQAESLGNRYSVEGKTYQRTIRQKLNLPPKTSSGDLPQTSDLLDRATLLIMGGGEGVGSLLNITDALYVQLMSQGIDALILVVCGRNEVLRSAIKHRNWVALYEKWDAARKGGTPSRRLRSIFLPNRCTKLVADITATPESLQGTTKTFRKMITPGNAGSVRMTPIPKFSITGRRDPGTQRDGLNEFINDDEKKISKNGSLDKRITLDNPDLVDPAVEREDDTRDKEPIEQAFPCHEIDTTDATEESFVASSAESSAISSPDLTQTNVSLNAHNRERSLEDNKIRLGDVTVVGLGFIENMAEYMVATDILISKAGPGTISESASLSLPIMLTSFLPGQEEGNVDFVINADFGKYCDVADPTGIAEEVCIWLQDENKMKTMSINAKAYGNPHAARDIARCIGEKTLRWLDQHHEMEESKKLDVEISTGSLRTAMEET